MASLSDPRIQHAIHGLTTIWNMPDVHANFARRPWVYNSWKYGGDFSRVEFTREEADLIIAHLKVQGLWLV